MADRQSQRPDLPPKRRSWISKYGTSRDKDKDSSVNSSTASLPVPHEGLELSYDHPLKSSSVLSGPTPSASGTNSGLPSRSNSTTSINSDPPTRPTTPTFTRRWSSNSSMLTRDELDQQASRVILNALERTESGRQGSKLSLDKTSSAGSFSRRSLTSMMGGLSSLYLTRSTSDDKERGRSEKKEKDKGKMRSSSYGGSRDEDGSESGSVRARSQSPFHFRSKHRARDSSPTVEALSQSDVESDAEVSGIRPRNAFTLSPQSDDESLDDEDEEEDSGDEESWSEGEGMDPLTTANTERNALIPADAVEPDAADVPDPLGEGVNVVIAPEPYFPTTLNASTRGPRRRKSTRPQDVLHLDTSRPVFQRDRCTITLTHGNPARVQEETGRRSKRYVLASDLSEESRYALEWGIGTVLRDGDEMLVVSHTHIYAD